MQPSEADPGGGLRSRPVNERILRYYPGMDMDTTASDSAAKQRRRAAGAIRRPMPVPINPDDPLLPYVGVAELLTELGGKRIEASTVRTFKRVGTLPLPDVQVGGEDYEPGETIKSYHRKTRDPKEPDPNRPWTVRERNGSSNSWLRSTIVAWNASRPGPGRRKGSPEGSA